MVSAFSAVKNESGRQDSNLRPLAPHASALAKLRHAPNTGILTPARLLNKVFPVTKNRLLPEKNNSI